MAASTVRKATFPIGPLRAVILEVTLAGVTAADITVDDHGLSNIVFAVHNNETTEGDGLLEKNENSGGSAELGTISLSGFTSGDVVSIYALGN